MSYGWLTESSLIPQPPKEIRGVTSISLLTLSDVIAKKEDESRRRQELTKSTRTRPTKKPRTWAQKQLEEENQDIDKRRRLDLPEGIVKPEDAPLEQSRRRLQEKARLYEALADGKPVDRADSSKASAVLDLELKRWQRQDERSAAAQRRRASTEGPVHAGEDNRPDAVGGSISNPPPALLRSSKQTQRRDEIVEDHKEVDDIWFDTDSSDDDGEPLVAEGKLTKAAWNALNDDSKMFLKELWTPRRKSKTHVDTQDRQFRREEIMRLMLMYSSQKASKGNRGSAREA